MLTEGARHIMGWQSPNFVYGCETQPKLRLLLRNYGLSDDIAFRFSNQGWDMWPLTAEKYLSWVKDSAKDDDIVNLFMDYETFGEHQSAASGIFDFMKALPETVLADGTFSFVTRPRPRRSSSRWPTSTCRTPSPGPMKSATSPPGSATSCSRRRSIKSMP
jgi:Alpha-amylase/alpha-mannosidase